MGVEVGITPGRMKRGAIGTGRTRCRAILISVSAADTFTSVHRFKGSIPQ